MSGNRRFLTEEGAVTPVISIILMVAIVSIVATAISAVALGVAIDIPSPAPQASFTFTPDDRTGDIIITKRSGDIVTGDQLKFSGAALEKTTYGSITEWAGKDVRAGDSATVDVEPGETLRLIWRPTNGRTEAILAEYDVPNDVGPTASIGSIDARADRTWVKINRIRFSRISDGTVYVVVKKRVSSRPTGETYEAGFSTDGGDLNATGLFQTRRPVDITVTVYETDGKSTKLVTATCSSSRFDSTCR